RLFLQQAQIGGLYRTLC
ncbi:hypothetical protein VCHENC02_4241B, partial [Vibrio harveyi]